MTKVNAMPQSLFDNLMNLTKIDDGFFLKDITYIDGKIYRIFNYRLIGWDQFHSLPDALECRGIMFRYEDYGTSPYWLLVSRPMAKFFNAHEGAIAHDYSNPMQIMTKEDGSLISTFIDYNDNLGIKSKGSLTSGHAIESNNILNRDPDYKSDVMALTSYGHTVNMEYTSPLHRIVLSYDKPALVVLNVRNNLTGEYYSKDMLTNMYKDLNGAIFKHWVIDHYVNGMDVNSFVESIADMKGIEGFVIQKNNDELVKIKTTEYIALHHSKDSVNNSKSLFECVVEDATDDLRTLFEDDQIVLDLISNMERVVDPLYNRMIANVENYYESNKELERKDYAIKGQSELEKFEFGMAMMLYLKKTPNYKETMKKRWKSIGTVVTKQVYGENYSDDI
jgi:T4 RnlA family RNA ligase